MKIDLDSLKSMTHQLVKFSEESGGAARDANSSALGSDYSSASGLDQMGSVHSSAIKGGGGSARAVLEELRNNILWLAQTLSTNAQAFGSQEDIHAFALDRADEGASVSEENFLTSNKGASGIAPLLPTPVIVARTPTVDLLYAQLQGSKTVDLFNARHTWTDLAGKTNDISDGLQEVGGYLRGHNEGAAIDAASSAMSNTASTASTFAANASLMNNHLDHLDQTRTSGQNMALKMKQILRNPAVSLRPEAAAAVEQAFLTMFPPLLTTALFGAQPSMSNLSKPDAAAGAGVMAAGMNDVNGSGERYNTNRVQLPVSVIEEVRDFAARNPGDFGEINEAAHRLADLGGEQMQGDFLDPAGINTAAASHGLPTAPPLNPMAAGAAGMPSGTQMAGLGGLPSGLGTSQFSPASAGAGTGTIPGGLAGLSPGVSALNSSADSRSTNGATRGAGGVGSTGGIAGTGGVAGTGAGGIGGANRMGGAGALGAGGSLGALPGRGGFPISAGLNAGAGAGIPNTGASSPNTGAGSQPTSARQVGAPGAAGSGNSAGHGRGMVPMMGGGRGAGQQKSKAQAAKAVTSQVERKGNLRALLGEAKPVVPGVIGDWVRD